MEAVVTWHGTDHEARELRQAVDRNCECETPHGTYVRCGAHAMLEGDQRAIDGLLFARHIAGRLLTEELRGYTRPAPRTS